MISKSGLRNLLESRGPDGFVSDIRHALGLEDSRGRRHRSIDGTPKIEKPEMRAEEFSLRCLAEAILGDAAVEAMAAGNPHRVIRSIQEAAGPGVDVTAFANINAFTSVVAGLVEVKVLEGYNHPQFIGDQLFEVHSTGIMGGHKHIGIGGVGDASVSRRPGQPIKMASLSEKWIEVPETEEHSLGIEINYEAVASDMTGDILGAAKQVGEMVGYRREMRMLDVLLGVVNPYNYKGAAINTYLGVNPPAPQRWLNVIENPFSNWHDYNEAYVLFSKMTDPETGLRILATPTQVVCMPAREALHLHALRATNVEQRTPTTQATVTIGPNPYAGRYGLLTSPLLYQRATESTGLGLGEADANELWLMGDFKKAFGYRQFHPLQVDQATPTSYEMLSRRIVAAYFAAERGVPYVKEPRQVVKNVNS